MPTFIYENGRYRVNGELPAVGSRAPDISLVNRRLQNVSLTAWSGMRKIMNVVTSVDLASCARSIAGFDRRGADIEDLALLTVSCDLPFAHARFLEQNGLTRVTGLSAIRNAGFGENYGVVIGDGPLAGMFACAVVVLDENNTVVHTERLEDIASEPDYMQAFRALGIEIED